MAILTLEKILYEKYGIRVKGNFPSKYHATIFTQSLTQCLYVSRTRSIVKIKTSEKLFWEKENSPLLKPREKDFQGTRSEVPNLLGLKSQHPVS